jgi:NAD/NADP transhydrogenase beta subunit
LTFGKKFAHAMKTESANLASRSRASVILFIGAMAFWPSFTTFTALEERAGLSWLRTSDADLWIPIAALALVAAASAPLFARFTPTKRCVAVALSILAFAAIYGICAVIGVHFLHWDD